MAVNQNKPQPQKSASGSDFAAALSHLKGGGRASRQAWATKIPPEKEGGQEKTELRVWLQQMQAGSKAIFVHVSEGAINTFNLTSDDINATDWVIL